jgi:Fe-S cluster biogenesis protein NfuA
MSDVGVVEAVRGLQELIEADGGAFEFLGFESSDGVVSLRLVLDRVTCPECILPPEMLQQIASDYLRRCVPGVTLVKVEDPRQADSVS